jgi:hypothetical protein
MILPTATLVIAVTPYVVRIMRASMIEVLESEYVEMARLKGMPERLVMIRHALPNALGPAIVATTLGVGGSFGLPHHLALAGEIERASLSGGTPNTRVGGSASVAWQAPRVLTLGTAVRGFGYAADPVEGYFAPRHYILAEATSRLAVGRDLGWSATLDGGIGVQSVATGTAGSAAQPASRGAISLRYRPIPGLEFGASAMRANAAARATTTVKDYHASGWTVGGRVSF